MLNYIVSGIETKKKILNNKLVYIRNIYEYYTCIYIGI